MQFYQSTGTLIQASQEMDFSENQKWLPAQGSKCQVANSLSSLDLHKIACIDIMSNRPMSCNNTTFSVSLPEAMMLNWRWWHSSQLFPFGLVGILWLIQSWDQSWGCDQIYFFQFRHNSYHQTLQIVNKHHINIACNCLYSLRTLACPSPLWSTALVFSLVTLLRSQPNIYKINKKIKHI